jgi:hypothetical protein
MIVVPLSSHVATQLNRIYFILKLYGIVFVDAFMVNTHER